MPDLGKIVIGPAGEFAHHYTDIKLHRGGIYTFTLERDLFDGMPQEMHSKFTALLQFGWGNGYIAIPKNHPFTSRIIRKKTKSKWFPGLVFDITHDWMNHFFPLDDNEWTYSNYKTVPFSKGLFYVFGFDSAHAFMDLNNWPHERVVSTIENFVKTIQLYNYARTTFQITERVHRVHNRKIRNYERKGRNVNSAYSRIYI